ncbi:hypothetical protein PANDA_011437, partial [Ailuropoda melanoleuca]
DFSGSPNEDDHNKVKETKGRRVNRKPRRKFTKDELYLLNHMFEDTPYPDFITRKKLAERLCCQVYAIDNWFQNRRARLPLKERQRIFAARRQYAFPIQVHSRGVGCFSPETQWVPSQQDGSGDTGVPGIKKELSYASEYQGDMGSGLYPSSSSYRYESAIYLHPSNSVQYFENQQGERQQPQQAYCPQSL